MIIRLLLLMLLVTVTVVQAEESDPIQSSMWDYTREQFIGSAPYHFDERVKVLLPALAENSIPVPLQIDATAPAGGIEHIVVWADHNPIQHIFTDYPHPDAIPELRQLISSVTDQPIRYVLNTHHHPDYFLGNQTFQDSSIYALPETNGVLFTADIVFYQRGLTTPYTPDLNQWMAELNAWKHLILNCWYPGMVRYLKIGWPLFRRVVTSPGLISA